ncbi:MAG: HPr(Ser) kinase/phosphatase [Gammaproteobacteria bacterium]
MKYGTFSLNHSITLSELYRTHKANLSLEWKYGQEFADKTLSELHDGGKTSVAFLNFVHPSHIVLLGTQEFHYLANLDVPGYQNAIDRLFSTQPLLLLICEDQVPTEEMLQQAQLTQTPIWNTHMNAAAVLGHLSHFLSMVLAPSTNIHGVFMEVFDLGVLLTGDSGVGKSELALELINRGHRLIADDSPVFSRDAPDSLTGRAPDLLKDFLEVRGLGIINVRAMFGNTAVKDCKKLNLIVHIVNIADPVVAKIDRLEGMHRTREILGVDIPEVTIPAGPGRSLSVLVEASVHNQVLRKSGYQASEIFAQRQRNEIENS